MDAPILYIVIPCYNEETVLPVTHTLFLGKLESLIQNKKISENSRVLFVDDGSKDNTWAVISDLRAKNPRVEGLKLSRNQGHQNALLAGLMTAKDYADITISIDCDGQDDVDAMDKMLEEYKDGAEIVYGVRAARDTDTVFKRTTAKWYYKILNLLGAEVVYNHADYRLMSRRALEALSQFHEVNLFLRGLIPLVGFKSSSVYYDRKERMAGESHYPLSKMLSLGFNGITSLSVRPLKLITSLGFLMSLVSLIAVIVTVIIKLFGYTVQGWTSLLCVIFLLGGIQIFCLGVIGEYIGKMYAETKARPRYIIEKNTLENTKTDAKIPTDTE
ncbi:MAG: glycosyltransferase family 2 protein [Candidatus Fimenecus sp.]